MALKKVKVKNRTSAHFTNSSTKSASSTKPAQSKSSHSIFEDVVGVAETLLHSQKAFGAGKLHEIAEATRGYAASMPNLPTISEQINITSETIEDLADYIVQNNMEQIIADAGALARRRPLATLFVTMAAGLAASRLLMPHRQDTNSGPKKHPRSEKKMGVKGRRTNVSAHA